MQGKLTTAKLFLATTTSGLGAVPNEVETYEMRFARLGAGAGNNGERNFDQIAWGNWQDAR